MDNSILLTETACLLAIDSAADDQLFGWFADSDGVTAAVVRAPRHPPMVSRLTRSAVEPLVEVLPAIGAIRVDGRDIAVSLTTPSFSPQPTIPSPQGTTPLSASSRSVSAACWPPRGVDRTRPGEELFKVPATTEERAGCADDAVRALLDHGDHWSGAGRETSTHPDERTPTLLVRLGRG